MAEPPKPTSILSTLGEEIIRIITPVSVCMFLVVLLVTILNDSSDPSSPLTTIATLVYNETTSDSIWDKLEGALLYSLIFIAVITITTFILVLLFYLRCTKFLKLYMGFSAFIVLGFMGGELAIFLITKFGVPVDCFTFLLVLYNFAVVGVMAVFMSKMAIFATQGYLVVIAILVAYWFTQLPEWTTWVLLVAMSLYDLAAVLLPGGPLRLLVELAMSREEEIPALVYEARPITHNDEVLRRRVVERRLWKGRVNSTGQSSNDNVNSTSLGSGSSTTIGELISAESHQNGTRVVVVSEEGQIPEAVVELSAPLIERENRPEEIVQTETLPIEGIGLGSSGAIKLGLGDFIFYSVLVGRAAMYDLMTVYACYLAIIAGLGVTLMLLALYHKALPALPVSIMLGLLFYFLTRFLLEAFIVQLSTNLVMF